MKPNLQRILMAYRPLYLHGLLIDGQYRLPRTGQPADPSRSADRMRQRGLLAALAHVVFHPRSKP